MPDAVNVQGGTIHEDLRPALPMVEILGQVLAGLSGKALNDVLVKVRGDLANLECDVLATSALKGMLTAVIGEGVSYVNAPILAKEREITAKVEKSVESELHRNVVSLRGTSQAGEPISVSGTLVGLGKTAKLIEINGQSIDVEPTKHMLILSYSDKPGVVGAVGNTLGKAGINIAGMQVGRTHAGGLALMLLTVDSAIAPDIVSDVADGIDAQSARYVALV